MFNKWPFLAEITREELQLNASEFIVDIALPALACERETPMGFISITYDNIVSTLYVLPSGMILALLFVLLCAWEGFCCRRCIEGDEKGCCGCCDVSTYDQFA